MFLKKQKIVDIKGRTCSDRRNKREESKKYGPTSPMAATESVLMTAAIYATEGRDIAILDASGVLLTADMDKEFILAL